MIREVLAERKSSINCKMPKNCKKCKKMNAFTRNTDTYDFYIVHVDKSFLSDIKNLNSKNASIKIRYAAYQA